MKNLRFDLHTTVGSMSWSNYAVVFCGLWGDFCLILNHNNDTIAKAIYSVVQSREIKGMHC